MLDEREQRIRERAYRMWLDEGRPEGRAADHWDKASELVAIEENYRDTLKPNPTEAYENSPTGEPVEPELAARNMGDLPTLTDQGEEITYPDRSFEPQTDEPPLSPGDPDSAGEPAADKGAIESSGVATPAPKAKSAARKAGGAKGSAQKSAATKAPARKKPAPK